MRRRESRRSTCHKTQDVYLVKMKYNAITMVYRYVWHQVNNNFCKDKTLTVIIINIIQH